MQRLHILTTRRRCDAHTHILQTPVICQGHRYNHECRLISKFTLVSCNVTSALSPVSTGKSFLMLATAYQDVPKLWQPA